MLDRAIKFASDCHAGQFRKYPDGFGLTEPYIMHPARVAGMAAYRHQLFPAYRFEDVLAAAWLHDVFEDCDVDMDMLVNESSPHAAVIVLELTNPSKKHPELNRAARKAMDRKHLATIGREAKLLKMMDRMDNVRGIIHAPREFALKYLDESELLAEVLRPADRDLFNGLAYTINAARRFFNGQARST